MSTIRLPLHEAEGLARGAFINIKESKRRRIADYTADRDELLAKRAALPWVLRWWYDYIPVAPKPGMYDGAWPYRDIEGVVYPLLNLPACVDWVEFTLSDFALLQDWSSRT